MKRVLFVGIIFFAALWAQAQELLKDSVETEEAAYIISIDKRKKVVEVVRSNSKTNPPLALRLLIQRKDKKPIEVLLHAMDRPDGLQGYRGHLGQWNGSMVGFQLDFSFDRKTWKRIIDRVTP